MAQVLQLCEMVNSGIHPIQNLKVLKFLTEKFQATTEERNEWSQHWIEIGFRALEEQVKRTAGECCFGDQLSAADCFLIPQMYNARRFAVDVKKFPTLLRIDTHIQSLPFAVAAHPDQQPDAPKS
jgi:maleylacetoacetate isomerase